MENQLLRDETVGLLQELLRLNTVNPPGNETIAAELLRDYLGDSGLSCELYAREPGRANLVARIPGRGDGPSLLLLSHTDTVVADPDEWSVDPWSGALQDGCVWGRGALDMKGHVAAAADRDRHARPRGLRAGGRSRLRRDGRRGGRRRRRASPGSAGLIRTRFAPTTA